MPRGIYFATATWATIGIVLASAPTISDYPGLYRQLRLAAEKSGAVRICPAYSLEAADAANRKAESLIKSHPEDAARAYRLAFWQLPRLPIDPPDHLSRVLGGFDFRHGGAISCVAYDPTGEFLASASADGTVRIWNLLTGRLQTEYRQHHDPVRCVLMLPNGEVVSASDKDIHVWDGAAKKPARKFLGSTGPVTSVAATADGKWLASSGDDRIVRVWDVATGMAAYSLGVQNSVVNGVDISRDGRVVASVNGDGVVTAWDTSTKEHRKILEQRVFGDRALGVRLSPDAKCVAVCGERSAKIVALPVAIAENAEPVGVIRRSFDGVGGHSDQVTTLAFSPDGKQLATGGRDFSIRLWDVNSGQMIRSFTGHSDEVSTLAFSQNGWQLASAGPDQSIRIWDLEPVAPSLKLAGHVGPIWSAAVTGDGRMAITGGADRNVVVWDAESGQLLRTLTGHQQPVTAVAMVGRSPISASGDRTIRIWSDRGNETIRILEGHKAAVLALAISTDEKMIVSGGADQFLHGHEVASGKLLFSWPGHAAAITAVAIRNDGGIIASASADGVVHLWNAKSGQSVAQWKAHEPGGAAALVFSADGQSLYSCGGDRLIKIWNLESGTKKDPIAVIAGHTGPVSTISVSRDGRLMASGGADSVVKIWDISSRTEVQTFRGHGEWVASVAFYPDSESVISTGADSRTLVWRLSGDVAGATHTGHSRAVTALATLPGVNGLASGSRDRTVIAWDLASGKQSHVFRGNKADIIALVASSDGKRLLCSSEDRKVRLINLENGQEVRVFDTTDRVLSMVFPPNQPFFLTWQFRDGTDDDAKSIVNRIQLTTGKSDEVVVETGRSARCLSFSPDGLRVAIGTSEGAIKLWNIDAKMRTEVRAHDKPMVDIAFTSDKRQIVTATEDGEIRIWPAEGKFEKPNATAKAEVGSLIGLSSGPNGRRFAAFGATGIVQVFDTVSGRAIRSWKLNHRIGALAFTADGNQIAIGNGDGTVYLLDLPND